MDGQTCAECIEEQQDVDAGRMRKTCSRVIEVDLSDESRERATLYSPLTSGEEVEVFVEAGSSLGLTLEARLAAMAAKRMDKRFDTDENLVGVDVIAIAPDGMIDRHNKRNGTTKIKLKDQIVKVSGIQSYPKAKELLEGSGEYVVTFKVTRRSGVRPEDIRNEYGSRQLRASGEIVSQDWTSGQPTIHCHHQGCSMILRSWCDKCVPRLLLRYGTATRHPLESFVKYLNMLGWSVQPKVGGESIGATRFFCPQHSQEYLTVALMPCYFDHEREWTHHISVRSQCLVHKNDYNAC